MRERRRQLAGTSAALLLALAAACSAQAASGPAPAAPSLASEAQKPFLMPRERPTETDDHNRNAYSVPQAAG